MRTVKNPEVRRQEILGAATELFLTRTYEATSTTDVMKALGIAKGTIYHYFPSKEKLMEAVVEELAEGYVQRRVARLAACGGNALMKIRVLFSPGNQTSEEKQTLDRLHHSGNARLHTRLLAVTIGKLGPVFGDLIRQGCEEDLFETEYPVEVAEFLLAGVQFLTDPGLFPWTEEDIRRRVGAYPSIVESTLKSEPGSFHFLHDLLTGQAPEENREESDDPDDA